MTDEQRPKCPRCERRLSERVYKDFQQVDVCDDPCHDLADDAITLERRVRKLERINASLDRLGLDMTNQRDDMMTALGEIAKKEGPFSRDPRKHAENCVEAMADLATAAQEKARKR